MYCSIFQYKNLHSEFAVHAFETDYYVHFESIQFFFSELFLNFPGWLAYACTNHTPINVLM